MRRDVTLLAVLAIAIVALAVPVRLAWHALPAPSAAECVAGELAATTPVPIAPASSGSRRLTVDAPRLPNIGDTEVGVEVATYTLQPSLTVELNLLGAHGEQLGSCRIPPTDYSDNGTITCPVPRPDRVRRIAVEVRGDAPFALYAANENGKLVAGTLVQKHRFRNLGARLDALGERLGVTRPAVMSPFLLFVSLVASIALLGTGLLLATGRERGRRG